MLKRKIGPSRLETSALALGSWHTWDRAELATSVQIVSAALEAGVNHFEVAHYNSGAHAEGLNSDVIFGRILQDVGLARDHYSLAMKLWLWNRDSESLRSSLDTQLYRVGADFADTLVLGHYEVPAGSLNPAWDGWKPADGMRAIVHEVADLLASGKARNWAVCNWSAATLRSAYEIAVEDSLPLPQYVQLKYSAVRRTVAEGAPFKSLFTDTGITLQAADSLDGGFLAGKQKSTRQVGRDAGAIRDKILARYPDFACVARSLEASTAQLALAFCLTNPSVSSVLVGTTTMSQLQDNLGAIDLLERHGDAIRELTEEFWLDQDLVEPSLTA